MRANINKVKQHIKESGGNLDQPYVVDCDSSRQKSCQMKNISPCSISSRNKGHWLIHRNRRMNIKEMMRLQGIDPKSFKQVVPDSVMGQQLGNAMSVNVVERILSRALVAAGLVQKPNLKFSKLNLTRWETGQGLAAIRPKVDLKRIDIACNNNKDNLKSSMINKIAHVQQDMKWPEKDEMYVMATHSQRKLMVDSGASVHMVNEVDLSEEELSTRRKLDEPYSLRSATQVVWVTECVEVWIHELEIMITACLTDIIGCPCVLSLGKLVNENRLGWHWTPGKTPY